MRAAEAEVSKEDVLDTAGRRSGELLGITEKIHKLATKKGEARYDCQDALRVMRDGAMVFASPQEL